jgi:cell division protein FtsL
MATNSIAQPALKSQVTLELHRTWYWLALGLITLVALGWCYSALSDRVTAANNKVTRLETNLRAEQARGDAVRLELAELQSLERLIPMANGTLQMAPASAQNVAFVTTSGYIAVQNRTAKTGSLLEREFGTTVLPGYSSAVQSSLTVWARAREKTTRQEPQGWFERLIAGFAPANAAASEREPYQ